MSIRKAVDRADLYAKCALHGILLRADSALRHDSSDEEYDIIRRHRAAVAAAAPFLWPEAEDTTEEAVSHGKE